MGCGERLGDALQRGEHLVTDLSASVFARSADGPACVRRRKKTNAPCTCRQWPASSRTSCRASCGRQVVRTSVQVDARMSAVRTLVLDLIGATVETEVELGCWRHSDCAERQRHAASLQQRVRGLELSNGSSTMAVICVDRLLQAPAAGFAALELILTSEGSDGR